jgi:hypothetical protein
MSKIYYTHDNGGRPFKVTIDTIDTDANSTIHVYKHVTTDETTDETLYTDEPIISFTSDAVFVGKSPLNQMTEFSGGHGSRFDGNSLLLKTGPCVYTYIGESIFSFETRAPVVNYVSLVGNNDVPYPYAIDEDGCIYLLIENIVLKQPQSHDDSGAVSLKSKLIKYDNNPYVYYYASGLMTPDCRIVKPKQPAFPKFQGITSWHIDNDQYTMRYDPNPEYDYNRMTDPESNYNRGEATEGSIKKMYITTIDNPEKHLLTKAGYIKLMKDFGKLMSFGGELKNKKIIVKRVW